MKGESIKADYFDGIFASDDDPWNLASSDYERAKFGRTIAALSGRRYRKAIEIGCAHGVLTSRLLPSCDSLLAVDISAKALDKARERLGTPSSLSFARMAFPEEAPDAAGFDLAVLSEVAYYWSADDLKIAARWLSAHVAPGGHILLVHFTGKTDYPQTGDSAVRLLKAELGDGVVKVRSERHPRYRLDHWRRC